MDPEAGGAGREPVRVHRAEPAAQAAGTTGGEAAAAEEAALLATYRVIHRIEDGEHARALARCGWTEGEFRAGRGTPGVEDEEEEEAFAVGAPWRGLVRRCTTTVQSLLQ